MLDARGLSCPIPVVEAKKALANMQEGTLVVLTDDRASAENVKRAAEKWGHRAEIEAEGEVLRIVIEKAAVSTTQQAGRKTVILLASDGIGRGDEALGQILMKSFLFALTQGDNIPSTLIMMNRGVLLAAEGSDVLESLAAVAEAGCEVMVCGTCADYFKIKERVAIGRISNMYEIVETLTDAEKVLAP